MTEEAISEVIHAALLERLRQAYPLNWDGTHGFPHWQRVREIGLRLAKETRANPKVVELFAFTHDIQRLNDHRDPLHGPRASQFIREHLVDMLDLNPQEVALLCQACEEHTQGQTEADPTVQTCWDADRLDLMRVGIYPDPDLLCTAAARQPEMIAWAVSLSLESQGYGEGCPERRLED